MNILFWNCKNTDQLDVFESLIAEYDCDIAAFAEFSLSFGDLIDKLHKNGLSYYHVPIISCDRINIFTKIQPGKIKHLSESGYYTIKSFPHPTLGKLLIGFAHITSKLHSNEDDQLEEAKILVSDIVKEEELSKTNNTILLGDFNMNPYEKGLLSATALNAFPTKVEVKKGIRNVYKRPYKMFYNPMWNFFGDKEEPSGTYFYKSPKHYGLKWNIFDQVLVRPAIMDLLDISEVKIISATGSINLLSKTGQPLISDHLPIFCKI